MIPIVWPKQLFDPMLGLQISTETGRIEDMSNNYGAAYAGGWDTIWDCTCNVRKLEEKKGA